MGCNFEITSDTKWAQFQEDVLRQKGKQLDPEFF
jgi:hypothetical protein